LGFGKERYYRAIYYFHHELGYFRVVICKIAFIPIFLSCATEPESYKTLFRALVPVFDDALRRDKNALFGSGVYVDVVFRGVLEWRLLYVRLVSLSAIENVQETGALWFLRDC